MRNFLSRFLIFFSSLFYMQRIVRYIAQDVRKRTETGEGRAERTGRKDEDDEAETGDFR